MKKKCIKILESENKKRIICIDEENAKELFEYLDQDERHRKKFKYIANIILNGLRNTEVYDKEDVNEKCRDITAMKFFKGQENDRIYCKEFNTQNKTFVVVASRLFRRKSTQKNTKKIINILEAIASYEYEVIE